MNTRDLQRFLIGLRLKPEVFQGIQQRMKEVAGEIGLLPMEKLEYVLGDASLVNMFTEAFKPRIPFTSRKIFPWRA